MKNLPIAMVTQASNFREVLDCGSPLPLFISTAVDAKAPEGWRSPRRCRDVSRPGTK